MQHFIDIQSLESDKLIELLNLAQQIKIATQAGKRQLTMSGRCMALFFEKPSLRTRVSFEAAVAQLGGYSIFIQANEVGLGKRESVKDFAHVISQYVDVLVARVFQHRLVAELAQHATIPIINGLSDTDHPCQAIGDLLTIRELFGSLDGRKIAFIGDGNNVARSLAAASAMVGAKFVLAAPEGYHFAPEFLHAIDHPESVAQVSDPNEAVVEADIVYTDVWTSMGQEEESQRRMRDFAGFQINPTLMAQAPKHARVMHCLPAHRGEEIAAEVIDGPQSAVIQQASNRLHAQKGLLVWLSDQWDSDRSTVKDSNAQ